MCDQSFFLIRIRTQIHMNGHEQVDLKGKNNEKKNLNTSSSDNNQSKTLNIFKMETPLLILIYLICEKTINRPSSRRIR